MFDLMERGGPFMWVILAASGAGIGITVERAYVLWGRFRLNAKEFLTQLLSFIDEDKLSQAVQICEQAAPHPAAEVLKAGLMKANQADKDIQSAMEAASIRNVPRVTARINYISVVANIATLLGLLGTILGLITTFEGVGEADAAMKQEILSKGIGVAMFTTAAGLTAAVPNIVAHAVLQNRQNQIITDIQALATDLYNHLSARNRRKRA